MVSGHTVRHLLRMQEKSSEQLYPGASASPTPHRQDPKRIVNLANC